MLGVILLTMFDIAFFEVVAFVRQASGAVAGAAGLHSWLLYTRKHHVLSNKLQPLMVLAAITYVAAWGIGFVGQGVASAHVGISLEPTISDIIRSHSVQLPAVIIFLALIATSKAGLRKAPKLYSFLYFVVASVLVSTYAISDHFDLRQVSYVWHGWHSILTLGTVIVLDYLFFICRHNRDALAQLHLSFDRFTLFILAGLAMDIMSTYMILEEALRLDTRFFFMQTVIGVLLVNGILLSGPLTRRASVFLASKRDIPKPLHTILGLAGSISLVSWTTITFLDFVPDISLSYKVLAMVYVTVILCGFITHMLVDGWPFGRKSILH